MTRGIEHLAALRARHSHRHFDERGIERSVLLRVLEAATTAPSGTNRQPWRFAVVVAPKVRERIATLVKEKTAAIESVVATGAHADEFGNYGDFFWEPLQNAAALIIPQYREYPDALANFIRSAGADPDAFALPGAMQPELCATSASIMALLLQAQAEGLGAVWMAGPMVAKPEIEDLLQIRAPFRMLGGIALGYPKSGVAPTEAKPRRPLDRVARWFEDETEESQV